MTKDYRIKITIRNERLLSAIESMGYASVRKFSNAFGLGYMTVVNIVSGKIKPINDKGFVIPTVEKILDILGLNIEEAFTPRQLQGFKKHSYNFSIKEKEIESLMNPVKNSELKLIESDVKTALENSMKTLTPREELVIDEIAKFIGVTRERVRQIEIRGIKKLRHPARMSKILEAGVKDIYTSLDIKEEDVKRATLWGQTWAKKIN